MDVYIVVAGWDYEGENIQGVYLSEVSAKKEVASIEAGNCNYDTVDYYEVEVKD